MTEIQIYEGMDTPIVATITDSNDDAIDLTDSTVLFTVKEKITDSDDDALISKNITSHTTPASGITTITITREDTLNNSGTYTYDIQLEDSSGNRSYLSGGTFKITQVVTDREVV